MIRNGTNGVSALDLAAELLADYGCLRALASARPEELAARRGIGAAKAAAIVAACNIARRADARPARRVLRRPADVADAARRELSGGAL